MGQWLFWVRHCKSGKMLSAKTTNAKKTSAKNLSVKNASAKNASAKNVSGKVSSAASSAGKKLPRSKKIKRLQVKVIRKVFAVISNRTLSIVCN